MKPSNDELHICGLLVHARPEAADRLADTLCLLPGLEIHARDPSGKLVLTLEADSEQDILHTIDQINQMDGVLAANLVYHQSESAQALEECVHENHTS